jgi:hypothetical protein
MTQAFNLSQFANNVNTSGQASLTTAVTGTLPVANGGTGITSAGSNGNVLTSNGSIWTSAAPPSSAPTTAQVGTASAGFAVGDLGTYAFLINTTGAAVVSAGTNYAGSGLAFSGVGPNYTSSPTSVTSGTSGSTTSGTWKAMGTTTPFGAAQYALTLFLRVA